MILQFVKKLLERPVIFLIAVSLLLTTIGVAVAAESPTKVSPKAKFSTAVAFDISSIMLNSAPSVSPKTMPPYFSQDTFEMCVESSPDDVEQGFTGNETVQNISTLMIDTMSSTTISAPLMNFEGLSNQDNYNLFGFRVNPPSAVGDVGPNHYVQMVNLAFAVYDKEGNLLLGPTPIGALWQGFSIDDCTDPSGDPIVLYDQLEDRWILSQFTTRGLSTDNPLYNCVAISTSGDPTGSYYRYAFITQPDTDGGYFFPDYPKYGVWTNSYILTTRDFGTVDRYGVSIYALEKNKMIAGNPKARAVQFFLDSDVVPISLMGDGLLPPDIDGLRRPLDNTPAPLIGTQDNDGPYSATFDAINIFELSVQWNSKPKAVLSLKAQLPVAAFDSIFPCAPNARDCLPQPGISEPAQYLDFLVRQRPLHRLAYRNFGRYEALVTNQSVEADPGVAGVRWYEIRRSAGQYSLYQQGTYAPADGVHRWMGSIAMDWKGDIAVGYSVVNGVDVYPGIRYTGRLSGDPLGQMTLGEGVIINGTGVQTTTNSRWGDYTSMNIDPVDDCTFWYVNEYYSAAGQASSSAGWQTRISSFKLPGCEAKVD